MVNVNDANTGTNTINRFSGNLSVMNGSRFKLNVAELNLRLLLTDKVILHTHRLAEVNDLIRLFGVKGLMTLLESDKLGLTCEAFSFGFRHDLVKSEDEFLIVNVWGSAEQRDSYLNSAFGENVMAGGGTKGLSKDIKRYIEPAPGAENSASVRSHFHSRLMNDRTLLRRALVIVAAESGIALDFDKLEVSVEQCAPGLLHYKITTNLLESMPVTQRRWIISSALSAIATVGMRMDVMSRHDALIEFRESDLPILETHLKFLENAQPMEQLRRTMTLTDAPIATPGSRISADRMIKASSSAEFLQFRRWLQSDAPHQTDEEIQRQFQSRAEALRAFFVGGLGRHLKFIAIATANAALSPAAGFLLDFIDSYLLASALKPTGHVFFVNHTYPSVFEKALPHGPNGASSTHSASSHCE